MTSVRIARLDTRQADFDARLQRLLHVQAATDRAIEERVASILDDVRSRGDAARARGHCTFRPAAMRHGRRAGNRPSRDLVRCPALAADAQRRALQAAADRVRRYHERQLQACGLSWSTATTTARCWARR